MGTLGGSHLGIFYPNSDTQIRDIKDGTTNTLMVGEMQRLAGADASLSLDSWSAGGVANIFDTDHGTIASESGAGVNLGINGGQYEVPGSDHVGDAHFGLVDGSVRFIRENIDTRTFNRIGTADGQSIPGEFLADLILKNDHSENSISSLSGYQFCTPLSLIVR